MLAFCASRTLAAALCSASLAGLAQTRSASPDAPYQDRVIEGLSADEPDTLAQRSYNSDGLPRAYSLETLWSQRQTASLRSSATGLKASAYLDSLQYGTLSGQLTAQNESAGQGVATSYVLRQIGMPFDGGWRANQALGMVNLPLLELARSSPRLTLPAPAMQGITSHWQQSQGLNVMAAWGKAGQFSGYPVAGFGTSQGSYGLLGWQDRRAASDGLWQWGGMYAQAQHVPSGFAGTGQSSVNAHSMYAAARREWRSPAQAMGASMGPDFVQANALTGRNTGTDAAGQANPTASGAWVDGGFAQGAHQHSWGMFWLEPGMGWLDLPTASDLQGGYWRHAWRTRQWSLESGLELLGAVSGRTPRGYFASHSVRYQYSSQTSFGGAVNLRDYGVRGQSLLLFSQFANGWGNTRAQLDAASAETGERQVRLQIDHDWSFVDSMRLSTALSLDRNRPALASGLGRSHGLGAALSADWILNPRWSLNHSLQGYRSSESTQYTLNLGLTWRIAPQWSLQTHWYAIQGSSQMTSLVQSPLSTPALVPARTNDRGVFVSLRYEDSAGQARAPLGGPPGSAAGKLVGVVYLDENKNAQRDAAERGAANVTVMLDGRYASQTSASGQFEFAYVVAGPHVLTVVSDNLPLPWGLDKEGRTELRIYTRETTTVDIGAQKQ